MTRERTKFKAWVSRFALSGGIKEVEVEDCFHISPTMVCEAGSHGTTYHDGDWHRTPEAAKEKAEQMRAKKIASLEKQIKKLKGMTF